MSGVIHAYHVARALAKIHTNDLFFTEVKNGSTWFARTGEGLRMDAVAIKKSWANPCITGYEIKVSRSDWLKDTKFVRYMAYCNEMWVVAPAGVIDEREIPAGVGYKKYNPNSGTVRTVIKATYREIEPPTDMLLYLIMQYAESDKRPAPKTDRRAMIEYYLQDKLECRLLASNFRSKLAQDAARAQDLERTVKREIDLRTYKDETIKVACQKITDIMGYRCTDLINGIKKLADSRGSGLSPEMAERIIKRELDEFHYRISEKLKEVKTE